MPPFEAIGSAFLATAQPLSAAENGEDDQKQPELANKDVVGMTDLDQLLRSEREREKEEMGVPPPVRYHSIGVCLSSVESALLTPNKEQQRHTTTLCQYYSIHIISSHVGRR